MPDKHLAYQRNKYLLDPSKKKQEDGTDNLPVLLK